VALDVVTTSWRELRAEIARALAGAGIENADAEARFIVEEGSGFAATEWSEAAEVAAPERAEARVREMCARRARGEPLQYALGAWSFRGLDLMVDPRVLIPRPETEWVVEVALEEAERLGLRRVKKRPALDVTKPPDVAEEEVAALPEEVVRFEPRHALVSGPTGMEAIMELVDEAPSWMAERATFVCEIAPHQAQVTTAHALAAGYDDAFVRPDLTGRPRVLVARCG